MPVKSCSYPGCNKRIPTYERFCDEHKKTNNQLEYKKNYKCREYSYLYNSSRWRSIRKRQLEKQPLCEECLKNGVIKQASVADHIIDHKGNKELFYYGALQSLCTSHHSTKTRKENSNP